MDVRRKVIERINNDDLTWINASTQANHQHDNIVAHTVFDYTQVYSLYQASENLEAWCKSAQAWVRLNHALFHTVPQDDGQGVMAIKTLTNDPNRDQFTLMIYIAPDYTLRILNSHPQYVSL